MSCRNILLSHSIYPLWVPPPPGSEWHVMSHSQIWVFLPLLQPCLPSVAPARPSAGRGDNQLYLFDAQIPRTINNHYFPPRPSRPSRQPVDGRRVTRPVPSRILCRLFDGRCPTGRHRQGPVETTAGPVNGPANNPRFRPGVLSYPPTWTSHVPQCAERQRFG